MAQIQTKTGSMLTTTSTTIAATNNYKGGNMLILISEDNFGDGTGTQISSISDGSNTWGRVTGGSDGNNVDLEIWAAYNCKGGEKPTITISYANSLSGSLILAEYNSIGTAAFDKSVVATGSSTAAASGNTSSLSQAKELILGVVGYGGVNAATVSNPVTGFGNLVQENNGSAQKTNTALADKIINTDTAQSIGMTLSATNEWVAICATFKLLSNSFKAKNLRPRPFAPGIAR